MKYFKHSTNSRAHRKIRKVLRTHGVTGFAIWWAILEELYTADEDGFRVHADELWLEGLAESLCISDYRTLVRVLDTFAELGLINPQLWEEHYIYSDSIREMGDAYIEAKSKNAERQARFREKHKTVNKDDDSESVSNALRNVESNDVTPADVKVQSSKVIDHINLDHAIAETAVEEPLPERQVDPPVMRGRSSAQQMDDYYRQGGYQDHEWVTGRQGRIYKYDPAFKARVLKYLSGLSCNKGKAMDGMEAITWLNGANYPDKPEGQKRLDDVTALWEIHQDELKKSSKKPTITPPPDTTSEVSKSVLAHVEWARNASPEDKARRLAEVQAITAETRAKLQRNRRHA